MRTLSIPCLLFASLVSISGCGDSDRVGPSGDTAEIALKDFGQMLKSLPADNIKPPTKMSEFDRVEPMAPMGGEALKNGTIVYIWGLGYMEGSSRVVAYEKNAESAGGWVLLQDGNVKKMSADEAKTAIAASKK